MDIREVSSGDGSIEIDSNSNVNVRFSAVSGSISKKDIKSTKNLARCAHKIESNVSFVQRRISARIQKIPQNKRPCYHLKKPKEKLTHPKICKDTASPKLCLASGSSNVVPISVGIGCGESKNVGVDEEEKKRKVKETLRIFNKCYLHFEQEEEMRCRKVEDNASNVSNTKNGDASATNVKRPSRRPDLKAISKMLEKNEVLNPQKRFGQIPGIDVGSQFFSRTEMVAVGLHGHWLKGIDYIGMSSKKLEDHKDYTFPLAVAIVLSGQYEDDVDNSEDIIYTGEGGNDLLGNKRQIKDQVMNRGNLALKNNLEQSVLVRVIRGHESVNSYSGKVYTYDGLYKIVKYWAEKGVSGFIVYKYCLRRIEGQPTLTTNQVHFARGHAYKVSSESRGLVCVDISEGQEDICIPATNVFDDHPVASKGFTYSKCIQVSESVKLPPNAPGCKCKDKCTNPNKCSCARLNGSDFPYVGKNGGRLVEAKDVVFECGPNCGCGPSCVNRTSQRGLKYRLEVFRTENKGWAVRSWDSIPSGAPVCEYIGEIKRSDELDNVSGNEYIFEIDCLQTIKGIGGRERRFRGVSLPSNHLKKMDDKSSESVPEFCIDGGSTGNVSRFINHSCEPNLFVQCVLSSHHDLKLARLVLFAADNILPLQELSYDYGYELDSVIGPDGKTKELPCYCGAASCRKRLY